jgi:SAM-dependent methyltransferase
MVADEIIRTFAPRSVLDAGCAMGLLVDALWDRGVPAQGIDISRYAIANVRPDMRSYCREASLTDPIDGNFDLVTCIEVVEHLEAADAQAVIANICKVTDTILFSSTPSDFDEPTHISVRPPIFWIEAFAAQGFGPDLVADGTFLTSHAMIFRRGNPCDDVLLRAYALIVRYRTLHNEQLEALAAERHHVSVAVAAQLDAETRVRETQARFDAQAALEAQLRNELEAITNAHQQAQAQAAREAELRKQTALSLEARFQAELEETLRVRQRSEANAALQAQLRTDALAQLNTETMRYQAHLKDVQRLIRELQSSTSWRVTLPLRLAVRSARRGLGFVRQAVGRNAGVKR